MVTIVFTIISKSQETKRTRCLAFPYSCSFVFNICRDVTEIPRDGTGGNACDSTIHDKDDDGHDIMESRKVPAFLVGNDDASCSRISSPIELGNVNWEYYGICFALLVLMYRF